MKEQVIDINALVQDDHNFNKGTEAGRELMEKSFKELGAGRSVLIDKDGRIIAGNKSQKAAIAAGIKKVRIIETTGDELVAVKRTDISLDSKEGRELALADNLTTQVNLAWDEVELDKVAAQEGIDLPEWGIDLQELGIQELDDEAEIERKRKEFEEKMAAGEISEEDEEYQAFLDKFKHSKTTDDCYTPEIVYEAVANWVANEYGLNRKDFVRPFYPGGDYQKEKYAADAVVVDNPPFSIMSEILKFYKANGIKFFLFGPHLTLFSNTSQDFTCLPVGVSITYENKATVNTSFVTNLEPEDIRFRSEPRLYAAVKAANMEYRKQISNKQADYTYDKHLFLTSHLCTMSHLGFDFKVLKSESEIISKLKSQDGTNIAIYGHAYIVSEEAYKRRMEIEEQRPQREAEKAAEQARVKAEQARVKAEQARVWPMSDDEWNIIKRLSRHD